MLRKKFSASRMIQDCRENRVTVLHYVGEIFRYVAATPPVSISESGLIFLGSLKINKIEAVLMQCQD